jgi:hypothetical protein
VTVYHDGLIEVAHQGERTAETIVVAPLTGKGRPHRYVQMRTTYEVPYGAQNFLQAKAVQVSFGNRLEGYQGLQDLATLPVIERAKGALDRHYQPTGVVKGVGTLAEGAESVLYELDKEGNSFTKREGSRPPTGISVPDFFVPQGLVKSVDFEIGSQDASFVYGTVPPQALPYRSIILGSNHLFYGVDVK